MFIVLVLFLLLIYFSNVNFTTKNDISKFILEDTDFYVNRMNKEDLRIRNSNKEEYKLKYLKGIINPSFKQRIILNICILNASCFLKSLKSKFINTDRIAKIPWRVLLLKNNLEHGYPHTRGGFIILPENTLNKSYDKITSVLIHEMIHVYQKKYNEEFKQSLLDNGFKIIGKVDRGEVSANPDIDELIYLSPDNKIMRHIKDRKKDLNALNEHPNELIAYNIAAKYEN